jgi:hypothetical protein
MLAAIPVLPVHDTHQGAQFYRERLGFVVDYVDDGYAILVRDRIAIHLWAATDSSWQARAGDPPVVSGAETFLAGTASCRVAVDDTTALCDNSQFLRIGLLGSSGSLWQSVDHRPRRRCPRLLWLV